MPTASDRGDIVFDGVSYNIDTNQLRINFKLPLGIYLADIVPENGNKGYIHTTANTDVYYSSKSNIELKEIHYLAHYSKDNTKFCITPIFQLSSGYYEIYIRAGGILTTDPLILLRKSYSISFTIDESVFVNISKREYPLSDMDALMLQEKKTISQTINILEMLVIGKKKILL